MTLFETMRRRAILALAAGFAAFAFAAGPAAASKTTEDYVQTNAQAVLTSLGAAKSSTERRAQFSALMDKFSDMRQVGETVLGRYARPLRADPALYQQWQATFREYGLATYEDSLDKYRGRDIKVLSSVDLTKNGHNYSIVRSQISQKNGQPLRVDWTLLQMPDGWKVVDVALKFDESSLSLVVQQQGDFLAKLDKNGGDIRKLIDYVKADTDRMRRNIEARNGGAKPG
ncbi:MAG: phospholipid-binding protein MlaC [Hyphomonadaceae bacterium]